MTPKWYTASYGNGGLEVTFYANKRAFQRAVRELEEAHAGGGWEIDSYTYGDVKMPPRARRIKSKQPSAE